MEQRCVSIQLSTPKIGKVLLMSTYGWAEDHARTLAMVVKVVRSVHKAGMPWVIFGDFNVEAKDMNRALVE